MKSTIRLVIAGFLFVNINANAQSVETRLKAVIDSIYTANPNSVGILVHVESPEHHISWSGASGYSNKVAKTKLEPDQPALIASNTKTYVSATILRLVEQGRLSIEQSIDLFLTPRTNLLFKQGGYKPGSITIKHLLSHTSGIQDYANQSYIDFIDKNKSHRWTRAEQLELAIKTGAPLGNPGTIFNYSDANYLLLTEIIEQITKKPFYSAMRDLLHYEAMGLNNTWFPTLEEKSRQTKALTHQYWISYGWDLYDIDISIDLYGGGGIACTTKDLANFIYHLFTYDIVRDTATFNLVFKEVPTNDPETSNYCLGITYSEYQGMKAYGHTGFWGTIVLYLPELEASISVFVLERDKRDLRDVILNQIIRVLDE